jgi:hypothetical protein
VIGRKALGGLGAHETSNVRLQSADRAAQRND